MGRVHLVAAPQTPIAAEIPLGIDIAQSSDLRAMVAVVIRTEGRIDQELLLARIARAHGFGRIDVTIRETILATIDRLFPKSGRGDTRVLSPEREVNESTPFRCGAPGIRDFWNFRMSS